MTSTNIALEDVKISPLAVTVSGGNVSAGLVLKGRKLLNNPNLWHKVIVDNCEDFGRDFILKTILDNVHPLDFIPVCYSSEGTSCSFFVRNCPTAIEKLCRQNLIVPILENKDKAFKVTIILAYCNTSDLVVNVQDNIVVVLNKRYTATTKMLNLDNFYKDPDLAEFCALSQPKILYFVLHLSKQFQIQHLKLSNNDINILSPIESICGMKSLTTLDLRNNKIEKITELNILKTMQITELFLDGNPLCDEYDEYSYTEAVKEVCPKIEKLDGVLLSQNGFPAFRRNYLCNLDGKELVDQFLEHYFSLYDTPERYILEGSYHKEAMLSITSQYLPGQSTTSTASLGQYKSVSRNLKLLSDLAKSVECLMMGPNKIIEVLKSLPATEHDPYSFTVDLVYYTETTAIVTVTGVFRERNQSLLDSEKILGFARTFILKSVGNGEYNIVNEQYHVSNATTAQQQRAFKINLVPRSSRIAIEHAHTNKEKIKMAGAFRSITGLNVQWSERFLEDCGYELKKALELFVDLYKVDKIPSDAFSVEES